MNESDKQKKIAFKKYITIELMRDGYMSLDKVYGIAAQFNQKQKTAERRLNPSESPSIETVKNDRGFIIGYRYKSIIEENYAREDYSKSNNRLFTI